MVTELRLISSAFVRLHVSFVQLLLLLLLLQRSTVSFVCMLSEFEAYLLMLWTRTAFCED